MIKRERVLSDLPSLADGVDDSTTLTWDFSLPPHVDQERIVVNEAQLGRILRVAAFRSLHVGEYQGKTTQVTPEINGITARGEATAGLKAHVDRAELQQHSMMDDFEGPEGESLMEYHGKTRVTARLNRPELASRVVDDKRDKGLSGEAAWVRQLNGAVNQSMRAVAKKHLMGREDSGIRCGFGRSYLPSAAMWTAMDLAQYDMPTAPMAAMFTSATWVGIYAVANIADTGKSMLDQRRWSVNCFSAEQWDRYAATQALTRAVPLIRVKK